MNTNRDEGSNGHVAGGPVRHIPVLLEEVLTALAIRPGSVQCDGTFGAGGYTRAILSAAPDVTVVAVDRDPDAVRDGAAQVAAAGGRLRLVEGRFGDLDHLLGQQGFAAVDGVVLDIGVSSMQIDEAERGFSFRHDAALDMRMEQVGRSAADIVNEDSAERLADILYYYGEERRARAIARKIVEERAKAPIETTGRLVEIVTMVERPRANQIHPATRTFQALRIAVNDELGELVRGLHAAERVLKPGGRLAVVTFHSLEDRIVKQFLASRSGWGVARSRHLPGETAASEPTFKLVERSAVVASEAETQRNPRSRSAKLRVAERTSAASQPVDAKIQALALLPEAARKSR